ncbi:hypothetical protein GCM10009678_64060 [Actinomadura kijaniata]|uniref:hypothetical protein n=1 Tax=Actinomadura kijaniata TaxID=46161 RepID=UPI002FEA1F37
MGIRRLAALGAVSGATLLGAAAPATAAPHPPRNDPGDQPVGPPRIKAQPNPFRPGDNLNLQVTGCEEEPKANGPRNEIFFKGEPTSFDDEGGGVWTAIASTRTDLKPGRTYVTEFFCVTPKGPAGFTLRATVAGKPKPPDDDPPGDDPGPGRPPADPRFRFDHGDVRLTTRRAEPGRTVGIRVTCPSSVRAYSASFSSQPRMEWVQKNRWEGVGRYRTHLPSIVRLTVECVGYGKVSFSTEPGRPEVDDGGPTIPRGAPDTGDGSALSRSGGGSADAAGPLAASLVALAGAGLARRRRTAREDG